MERGGRGRGKEVEEEGDRGREGWGVNKLAGLRGDD